VLNFSHRKALVTHTFPSVIWPLVTFWVNYFLRETPQVILVLMTPVLSFYHVRDWEKGWSHTHTHTIRDFKIKIKLCKIFLKSIGSLALSWKTISYYICLKTYKTNRFLNILTNNGKISHRKALEAYLFSFIIPPLVAFPQIFLSYVPSMSYWF
jgi:hypothetical protein